MAVKMNCIVFPFDLSFRKFSKIQPFIEVKELKVGGKDRIPTESLQILQIPRSMLALLFSSAQSSGLVWPWQKFPFVLSNPFL